MKNKNMVLHVALIAAVAIAGNQTSNAAYTLNVSDIPASIRMYAEENPDSFVKHMNDLMGQGYSESEALTELEKRLTDRLEKIEEDKAHARFLKEVEAVPYIERSIIIQNPELYKLAKAKLASGLPVSPEEAALLGIMKDGDGLYRPVSSAHPDHLHNELAYANLNILYNQAVSRIHSMMQWLRSNCPPREMPALESEHLDQEKPLDERSRLAQIEKNRIGVYYTFYRRQADERAAILKQLEEINAQLSDIENRLMDIEDNQHSH